MEKKKGKGKLLCKVGNLAVLMEDYGTAVPVFKFVFTDSKDNVLQVETVDMVSAIFLERCLDAGIKEAMSANISNLFKEN